MGPQLSPSKKSVIWELHCSGKSNSDIARKYHRHPSTIANVIDKMDQYRNPYYKVPGRGRPRKLDAHDDLQMVRAIRSGNYRDAADVHRDMFQHVEASTVRRHMIDNRFYGRIRRARPYLSPIAIHKRKIWAADHRKWTPSKWNEVWYTDESKFIVFDGDGKIYCRRDVGEENLPRNIRPKVKHGGGKVNVWGVISYNGVGELHRVNGNLDGPQLVRIMEDSLLRSFDAQNIDPEDAPLAMDNDPKHTSRLVQAWLEDNRILRIEWPSYSPDMNLIEHVWYLLDKAVRRHKPLPTSEDQLWAILEDEWYSIPRIQIRNLYDSAKRRVDALWQAKGHHTGY